MDSTTTIKEIKDKVKKMRMARGWKPEPRSYAISICLEAAELLEHFQWNDRNLNKGEIELEVADILVYLCDFANVSGIDLSEVLAKKLKKINEKYPEDEIKKNGGDFYYQQKQKYRKIS